MHFSPLEFSRVLVYSYSDSTKFFGWTCFTRLYRSLSVLHRYLLWLAFKQLNNLLCSWLDSFKILCKNTLLVRTSLLRERKMTTWKENGNIRSPVRTENTISQSSDIQVDDCVTVRIKVRSILFFMTADNSSSEISPLATVIPFIKSLFHSSSGAAIIRLLSAILIATNSPTWANLLEHLHFNHKRWY